MNSLRKLKILPHQSKIIGDSESCSIDCDSPSTKLNNTTENRTSESPKENKADRVLSRRSTTLTPPLASPPTPTETDLDQIEPFSFDPSKTKSVAAAPTLRFPPQASNSIEIRICKSSVANEETSQILPVNFARINLEKPTTENTANTNQVNRYKKLSSSNKYNSTLNSNYSSGSSGEKRPPLTRMANSSRSSSPSDSANDYANEHGQVHRNSADYVPVSRIAAGTRGATALNLSRRQSIQYSAQGRGIRSDEHETRINLMGQPMNLKQKKMGSSFQMLQSKIYNFLERPKGKLAITYHSLM